MADRRKERLKRWGSMLERKNGVAHVEPPVWLLENLLTLVVLLEIAAAQCATGDACNTHTLGRIAARDAAALARGARMAREWLASLGDAAFVPAQVGTGGRASRRRVLHVDYAATELPPPLQWAHEHLTRNEYSSLGRFSRKP